MVCGSCGTENPERARFCMSCGASLAASCPSCGAENPPGAKFCIECGTALQATAAAPIAESGPPEERRKATIIFADLSGYTAVSERLDPERSKSMVDRTLRRLGEEIERYGGTIDKYIGDNVMGVFGAPTAHEDDPERAVRAGLAMQAAMSEVNERIASDVGANFALRVGINSGEVLAGRVGDGYTVIGDPVNVAARLQAAAKPGTVIVGEVTHRLTRKAIEYVELEPLELKGKAEKVPAWEAVRAVVRGRATRSSASTPLVGRRDERERLLGLFEQVVNEGRPHLVTVIGQAGVGKTRLLRELTLSVGDRETPPAVRLGSCPAYGAGLAYWALGEIVRGTFDIVDDDGAGAAWRKLHRGVEALVDETESEESPERLAVALGRPLGIEPPPDSGVDGTELEDPQQMRERLFSAVRTLIEAASRRQPLIFAVEDIHWADEGMLDLIEYLARWARGPALFVCLARDELLDRRPGWGGGRLNATTLTLDPLAQEHTRALVGALLGEDGVSEELAVQVASRSGGNPLFAEEMVNRILEEGTGETEALPETVHSVLAARLDSLPRSERRVLQAAAVVGQTFWEGSVADAREPGSDLRGTLESLRAKDLIVPTAGSRLAGEREYAFKHVLIRDVAYSTLPKAVRARRHADVAEFISTRAADRSEGVIAMVAEHYSRAATLGAAADVEAGEMHDIRARALEALEAAGDASAAIYSNSEAQGHYEAALALGDDLDLETVARVSEKLGDVALLLGRVDRAVRAWDHCMEYHRGQENLARVGDLHRKIGAGLWHKGDREGSIEHYQRGIDLLKDGPPCLELVRLYEEAASLYMHTGDNMLAIYASEKALRLAERLGEAGAASRAHGIFGRVFGRIGDSERARENLERSVELARETDPAEAVRALFALGYHFEVTEADYEGARETYGAALDLAVETGDLPSQVEVHAALAQIAIYRGDWEAAEHETDASQELAEREGLAGKLCYPYSMRGVLLWHDGQLDESAEMLERAFEIADQVGRSEVAFESLAWLANTLEARGDYADADQALARALDLCERAGLVAQSVEATADRAVNAAVWGKAETAATLAEEAAGLAERLRYPVGRAASLEASGATAAEPAERERLLTEARDAWEALGRPLDAERCETLLAGV